MADDSASEKTREGTPPEEDFDEADQVAELSDDETTQDGPMYESEQEQAVRRSAEKRGFRRLLYRA